MTQATTQHSITSQTIAVEHIRISSGRSFVEVRRKLEGTVPKLDSGIAEALRSGDQKRSRSAAALRLHRRIDRLCITCCSAFPTVHITPDFWRDLFHAASSTGSL